MVMNQNAKRETGSIARANNIAAAKAVSDIIRTTLGPRSMLKMILDASGGTGDAMRAWKDDAFGRLFDGFDKRRRPKRSTAKKKKTRLFCLWNETTDDEYVIVFLSLSQASCSRTMGTPFFARLT